jgi:hypothetical protein
MFANEKTQGFLISIIKNPSLFSIYSLRKRLSRVFFYSRRVFSHLFFIKKNKTLKLKDGVKNNFLSLLRNLLISN